MPLLLSTPSRYMLSSLIWRGQLSSWASDSGSMARLSLELLGTGTSTGVPTIGCACAVCTSTDPLNKRLRSSALVRSSAAGGQAATAVVIDTPPDFRQQMLRSQVQRLDAVVITHGHADHVAGLDDVRRYNVMQNARLDCWATPETLAVLQRSFGYAFADDNNLLKGLPCLRPRPLAFGRTFSVGGLRFEALALDHTVLMSTGLIISSAGSPALAYCIDVKRFPPESLSRLKGVHTLVLDMLRETPHPTHLSLREALDVVERVAPERAYLAHIAHEVEHRQLEARLPPHVRLAYDGLIVELG